MCHVALATRAAGTACGREVRLTRILRARFSRKVLPGEELRILLSIEETAGGPTRVLASHSVDGAPAAEIRFEVEQPAARGGGRADP
jgi:3-hydroxymyristoyl/3-hydroxydecanoyl-(acyl carrier protein) dehydratase